MLIAVAVDSMGPEWVIVAIGGVCDGDGVCMAIRGPPSSVDVKGILGMLEVLVECPFEQGHFAGPHFLKCCRSNLVASIGWFQHACLECPFLCLPLPI